MSGPPHPGELAPAGTVSAARTKPAPPPPRGLDALVSQHPELERPRAILRALVTGMAVMDASLPSGVPNPDAARARLEAGISALEGEPLVAPDRLVQNVHVLEARLADVEGTAFTAGMARMLASLADDLGDVTQAALSGAWADLGELAAHTGAEEYALVTLLDYAVRPALRAGRMRAAEVIARMPWDRGRCPGCGAPPVLAELRGSDGERFLRCGRCTASWEFARVGCPFCDTREHAPLNYLHGEGEESYRRVQTCERCKGYVKELATLDPLPPTELLEIDLATAGLDLVAVERGYHR